MSVSIVDKSTGDLIKVAGRSGLQDASQTSYDNTSSGMTADDVQEAIDELHTSLSSKQDTLTFDDVPTDNSNNPVKSNGVYDALAAKQDATDNNLQTTAKTVVGGINEVNDKADDLSDVVSGEAKTVDYASVITVDDAMPVNGDVTAKIEPIQDLHGYDKPWAGGAGKNLIPMTVDGIKAANSGTWSGNTLTKYDVTYTILTDNDNNVIGIKANGTASSNAELNLVTNNTWFPGANTYTLTGGVSSGVRIFYYDGTSYKDCKPNPVSFTLTGSETVSRCTVVVASGSTANNDIFYPMIRVSTETDASFAPYTNICPISGLDNVKIARIGKNLFDSSLMVSPTTSAKWIQLKLKANTTYAVSSDVPNSYISAYIFAIAGTNTSSVVSGQNGVGDGRPQIITTGEDGIISFGYRTDGERGTINLNDYVYQIELGTTATEYEPYLGKTYTISLNGTRYGGTLHIDNKGNAELEVTSVKMQITKNMGSGWQNDNTHSFYVYNNVYVPEAFSGNTTKDDARFICDSFSTITPANCYQGKLGIAKEGSRFRLGNPSWSTVDEVKDYLENNDVFLVYEIATPFTVQLTPQQIQLLKGQNTIYADSVDIKLAYETGLEDSVANVQEQVNDVQSGLINQTSRIRNDITNNIADLPKAVSEQDLSKYGYKIGDYFTGASGYTYHLADMDTFYGGFTYNAVVHTHHISLVVCTNANSKWALTDDTSGGYKTSTLHSYLSTTVLDSIKSDMIHLFGGTTGTEHLVSHQLLWTTATSGAYEWSGSSGEYISALSEPQVYGTNVWAIDGYQTGEAWRHLEVFRKFSFNQILGNTWVWLRTIASATNACGAHNNGSAANRETTNNRGAVGLILFK